MRIVTLIENLVYKQGLFAEHGLAIYIETKDCKILFDTGQTGLFLQNARTLGIHIEEIDFLVLSHGHYDHTGGLYAFLEKNGKAKVYAKTEIFTPKYSELTRFIGTPKNQELLKDRITHIKEITEIAENIFIFPEIQINHVLDTHYNGLNIIKDGKLIQDEFDDELFLGIKRNEEINIVTACSHRGITNIIDTVNRHLHLPVNLIIGGFHTKNCTSEQYTHIIKYLRKMQPRRLGVCHCTGIEKYAEMVKDLDFDVFYNFTGCEIAI
jgi:7,8-dihydropterin-6-yl-methyl-4-(beta-D-ribofuranosyl)aminobenzene 5'-phosphate synthase